MSALGRALRGALRGALGSLNETPPAPTPLRLPARIAISVVGAAPFRVDPDFE